MGKTTLSVDESTLERFKEIKHELDQTQPGVPDHSADSFLNALLDTWEAAGEGMYDGQAVLEELKQEIDSISHQGGITKNETERIVGRIDDLEAQLPRKVAEEIQR